MRRLMMLSALVVLLAWGASGALAQKELTKDPLPFPTDGAGWVNLDGDLVVQYLRQPGGLQDFAGKVFPYVWEQVRVEIGPQLDQFGGQLETAWGTTLTRVVTVLLGGLLLWLPHRLSAASWLFIGIVAGVLLVQTDAASALLTNIFPDDETLRTGVVGVVVAIGLVSAIAGFSLGIVFLVLMGGSGWLAGALIGAQYLNNGVFDLASPMVFSPAILFAILMMIAAGRGAKLVAALTGAALVVAALRLAPGLIPAIGIGAMIVSLARTHYAKNLKREELQSLTLGEGRVTIQNRKHSHGISAEMQDDSKNSPFSAL